MKRFFLILLLLPSLGICSATYTNYHPHPFTYLKAITNIHSHSNSVAITRNHHRTYDIRVPLSQRYYPYGYHRHPNYPYRHRGRNYYHDHGHHYAYNDHIHGHR